MFAFASTLFAQQQIWQDPQTFAMAALSAVVFGAIGIVMAIIGFKLFDMLTPGKLDEEILQKQNIAAAVLAGFFVLGICIIVAAAIHG